MLAAQASERIARTSNSPNEFLDVKSGEIHSIEPQTGPITKPSSSSLSSPTSKPPAAILSQTKAFSPPPVNSPSKSRTQRPAQASKRKSNELGRLLDDLTGGIFMAEVRRKPSSTPSIKDNGGQSSKPTATPATKRSKNKTGSDDDEDNESQSSRSSSSSPEQSSHVKKSSTSTDRDVDKSYPVKKRKEFRSPQPESAQDGETVKATKSAPTKKKSLASILSATLKKRTSDDLQQKKKSLARATSAKLARKGAKGGAAEKDAIGELLEVFPTMIEDRWNFHDSEQCCAAKASCMKPSDENVEWICCELCEAWYHVACAPHCDPDRATDDTYEYKCGCADESDDDDEDDRDSNEDTKKRKKNKITKRKKAKETKTAKATKRKLPTTTAKSEKTKMPKRAVNKHQSKTKKRTSTDSDKEDSEPEDDEDDRKSAAASDDDDDDPQAKRQTRKSRQSTTKRMANVKVKCEAL